MATTLPEILRRFRPVAVPGPAGPAGVPRDPVAEAEAELACVFEALAPTVSEARRLREEAHEDAERRCDDADEEARRILADARARVDEVRADAMARGVAEVEERRRVMLEEAEQEAARIRARASERRGAMVAEVLADVRAVGGPEEALA